LLHIAKGKKGRAAALRLRGEKWSPEAQTAKVKQKKKARTRVSELEQIQYWR